jgi:hypothetical protein
MAFTDFKSVSEVQKEFNIKFSEGSFLQIKELQPPQPFLADLEFSLNHIDIFSSEPSRCENIIYPILREVYKNYADRYSLWSHKSITYNKRLSGIPDYIISTKSELGKTVLGVPLLIVVEAKKNDFEAGWGQCLAELVAAQKMNANDELPVYGIVTDGELWQFGKLIRNEFTKEKMRLTINDVPALFGVIASILDSMEDYPRTIIKAA